MLSSLFVVTKKIDCAHTHELLLFSCMLVDFALFDHKETELKEN